MPLIAQDSHDLDKKTPLLMYPLPTWYMTHTPPHLLAA
jgi:hypothetical protein